MQNAIGGVQATVILICRCALIEMKMKECGFNSGHCCCVSFERYKNDGSLTIAIASFVFPKQSSEKSAALRICQATLIRGASDPGRI